MKEMSITITAIVRLLCIIRGIRLSRLMVMKVAGMIEIN